MKRIVLSLAVISFAFITSSFTEVQESFPPDEGESGGVVCEPAIYPGDQHDCLLLGPARFLTDLSIIGLTIPPRPLPAAKPDPALTTLPYYYFRVSPDQAVPIYSGPCQKGSGASVFPQGFVYIAYVDVNRDCGTYYMLQDGSWIPGAGYRIGEISAFQGLEFSTTPRNSFGWAFEQIPIKPAPGYATGTAGREISPFQVLQFYTTQNVDDADWNMIAPNQWVEARKVAQVLPETTPPDGVTNGRWIDVNLAEQTLAVYDNNRMVFATMIATGQDPFWTRPGLHSIYKKIESETMRNNDPADFYYLEKVPWIMYFDGARALHGAYWRTRFGYPQSHGCVNLSIGDAHWLFNWAKEGDWVYVHDPSGLTPTDPALYSAYAY